ncbi:MAG: M14 family metallopeptidase [Bryobacteraceae bacterium]|nr:M14 family metallopeptidase [Bryobacteraceae bacterium]
MFSRSAFALLLLLAPLAAQKLTSPKEHFGFNIGDDYHLTTYKQTEAYFKKLSGESNRLRLVDIGKTEEGRTQYMMIASAPENLAKLARYKEIAQKLARAEGVTEEQARAMAAEGKAVIWIDGGLHSTETVGTHQLIEMVWQLASRNDAETQRLLRDCIVLLVHANPDGHDLISEWYMREPDASKRVMDSAPRLYQKYAGHDNNRDFYMSNLKESTNMNRQLFIEWFPQIMYNHHQTGPPGTVIFAPPFRDPFNYVFDPLIVTSLDAVGAAMHGRFIQENKPGSTMRRGASYSTWYNGGLRTTTYFHNMIGLLTEIIGSPTPMDLPFVPQRHLPSADQPFAIAPQKWHYRQSIDYSVTANRAVLDYASRNKDQVLYNIWLMGKNSIERGSKDSWTPYPSRIDAIKAQIAKDRASERSGLSLDRMPEYMAASAPAKYYTEMRKPEWRDPRGFIIPADQPDFPTAVKFLNTLVKTGITLHRATTQFTVNGKSYPAGSYVVKTNQAFRPHVLDMFEPQDHPNDFQYEGGPPIAPYDSTGWTLAFQMAVKFDRVLDDFNGPFTKLPIGELLKPPPGKVFGTGSGYLISHMVNDSFILTNRLLKAGAEVYWLKDGVKGEPYMGAGTIYATGASAKAIVEKATAEYGFNAKAVAAKPAGESMKLAPTRIALWDRFGGSMPSGWTRFMLEQFEFPFEVIYPEKLDAGDLRSKYDVIVFVTGAIPRPKSMGPEGPTRGGFGQEPKRDKIPAEFQAWLGSVSEEKTVPQLRKFIESGGTAITIGSSTNLAYHLGVPVKNALTEPTRDGRERALPRDKYYIPGSVLEVNVDPTNPVAYGMEDKASVFFDNSPVFKVSPDALAKGVKPVAWFGSAKPLKSGWAWGQQYLEGGVAIAEAPVGEGKLVMMGSEVAFRAQPHGTFKLLFNSLYLPTAKAQK